jgi:hypothetical protein
LDHETSVGEAWSTFSQKCGVRVRKRYILTRLVAQIMTNQIQVLPPGQVTGRESVDGMDDHLDLLSESVNSESIRPSLSDYSRR